MEDILLIGFGGHAKSVIDTIEKGKKYHIVGAIETDKNHERIYKNYKVIGTEDKLEELFHEGIQNAFVTIGFLGNSKIREYIYQRLKKIGYRIPILFDPESIIAEDAVIEEGTYVGKGAVINANATIGHMCIINTGAIVEHDCEVGNFSHLAVGAVVCGMSRIGDGILIGANATILQGISVGKDAKIGAGSIVLGDVPNGMTVYKIWKGEQK